MEEFNQVLNVVTKIIMVAAGLWTIWGGFKFFSSLSDHNAAETKAGLFSMAGGIGMFLLTGIVSGLVNYL